MMINFPFQRKSSVPTLEHHIVRRRHDAEATDGASPRLQDLFVERGGTQWSHEITRPRENYQLIAPQQPRVKSDPDGSNSLT